MCGRCEQYYVGMLGLRRHQASGPNCLQRLQRERMREMFRAGRREREQNEPEQARQREEEMQRGLDRWLEEQIRQERHPEPEPERQGGQPGYGIQETIRIDLLLTIL